MFRYRDLNQPRLAGSRPPRRTRISVGQAAKKPRPPAANKQKQEARNKSREPRRRSKKQETRGGLNFFAALRLPTAGRSLREEKKIIGAQSRQAAKSPPRPTYRRQADRLSENPKKSVLRFKNSVESKFP
jgi:hypothetical protein